MTTFFPALASGHSSHFPPSRRLSSVLSKFSHKNYFLQVSPPGGVTRGGPLVTPLLSLVFLVRNMLRASFRLMDIHALATCWRHASSTDAAARTDIGVDYTYLLTVKVSDHVTYCEM